jgi:hypothetical protein
LIHRDVKPHVLLTDQGLVRSRLYGLAGARDDGERPTSGRQSIWCSLRRMTPPTATPDSRLAPALASDRQLELGVSVLEMFTAPLTWKVGWPPPSALLDAYRARAPRREVTAMPTVWILKCSGMPPRPTRPALV